MELSIKAIKFEATDKLQDFIQKKASKLEKLSNDIRKVEVSLKVVKPETAHNKQVDIKVALRGEELFATKVSDTFEEATTSTLEALERQITKFKEKQR